MSLIRWHQPIDVSFRSSVNFANILFFFYLIKNKADKALIIRLIVIYGLIHVVLWGFALSQAPSKIFGYDEDVDAQVGFRGMARIFLDGGLYAQLLFFLALSRSFGKPHKWLWRALAVVMWLYAFADLTRFKMASVSLVAIYFIMRKTKSIFKVGILVAAVVIVLMYVAFKFFPETVEFFSMLNDMQFESGFDTTRIDEYLFFFTQFNDNPLCAIFGNGAVDMKYIDFLRGKGYYLSDVSYAAIFIGIGAGGLFCYLMMIIRGIFQFSKEKDLFPHISIVYVAISNIMLATALDGIGFATILYLLYLNRITPQNENMYNLQLR
jgi:hypothetical protein